MRLNFFADCLTDMQIQSKFNLLLTYVGHICIIIVTEPTKPLLKNMRNMVGILYSKGGIYAQLWSCKGFLYL